MMSIAAHIVGMRLVAKRQTVAVVILIAFEPVLRALAWDEIVLDHSSNFDGFAF